MATERLPALAARVPVRSAPTPVRGRARIVGRALVALTKPRMPTVTGPRQVANQIVGYTIALTIVSAAVGVLCNFGAVYTAGAVALGVVFVGRAWQLRKDPAPKRAMGLFHYSITYLTLLFVLVAATALLP